MVDFKLKTAIPHSTKCYTYLSFIGQMFQALNESSSLLDQHSICVLLAPVSLLLVAVEHFGQRGETLNIHCNTQTNRIRECPPSQLVKQHDVVHYLTNGTI